MQYLVSPQRLALCQIVITSTAWLSRWWLACQLTSHYVAHCYRLTSAYSSFVTFSYKASDCQASLACGGFGSRTTAVVERQLLEPHVWLFGLFIYCHLESSVDASKPEGPWFEAWLPLCVEKSLEEADDLSRVDPRPSLYIRAHLSPLRWAQIMEGC